VGYTIRFEGGSVGGKVEYQYGVFDARDRHIPVHEMFRATAAGSDAPTWPAYSTDIYRFEGEVRGKGSRGSGPEFDGEYVYRWVRPNIAGLQEQIRDLKKQVEKLKRTEDAFEALDTLRIYLNNGF
jgi:hypothetical protein